MTDKPDRKWRGWVTVPVILIVVSVVYMGAYYAMIAPFRVYAMAHGVGSYDWVIARGCKYSIGGQQLPEAANAVFGPANFFDRRLRPGYWALVPVSHGTAAPPTSAPPP